jgi:hypothetical protein
MKPRVAGLVLALAAAAVLAGCKDPSAQGGAPGEYGGVWTEDPDPGYKSVVTSESVGTGFGPWGGIYNYEEVTFGSPH